MLSPVSSKLCYNSVIVVIQLHGFMNSMLGRMMLCVKVTGNVFSWSDSNLSAV